MSRPAVLHRLHRGASVLILLAVIDYPLVYEPGSLKDEENRVLSESLADWAQRYPEVANLRELVCGRPAAALIERSQNAQLLVTGARGRGGFTGLVLGSVSQTVLQPRRLPRGPGTSILVRSLTRSGRLLPEVD